MSWVVAVYYLSRPVFVKGITSRAKFCHFRPHHRFEHHRFEQLLPGYSLSIGTVVTGVALQDAPPSSLLLSWLICELCAPAREDWIIMFHVDENSVQTEQEPRKKNQVFSCQVRQIWGHWDDHNNRVKGNIPGRPFQKSLLSVFIHVIRPKSSLLPIIPRSVPVLLLHELNCITPPLVSHGTFYTWNALICKCSKAIFGF